MEEIYDYSLVKYDAVKDRDPIVATLQDKYGLRVGWIEGLGRFTIFMEARLPNEYFSLKEERTSFKEIEKIYGETIKLLNEKIDPEVKISTVTT